MTAYPPLDADDFYADKPVEYIQMLHWFPTAEKLAATPVGRRYGPMTRITPANRERAEEAVQIELARLVVLDPPLVGEQD